MKAWSSWASAPESSNPILTKPKTPNPKVNSPYPRGHPQPPGRRHMFNVPICLITLVDVERQWFKACVGLDVSETGRWEEW